MEMVSGSWAGIGLAALLVGAGLVVGFLVARLSSESHARVRKLEGELRALREQQQQYRKRVGDHFGRTSEIFRDLTGEMRTLYTHLAGGAEDLCDDDIPALRFQQSGLLPAAADDTAQEREAAPSGESASSETAPGGGEASEEERGRVG